LKPTRLLPKLAALAGGVLKRHVSETGQSYGTPNQRPLVPTALQTVVEVILGLDQTPVRSGLAQQRSQTAVTKMAK
jgi:hypothetical protein